MTKHYFLRVLFAITAFCGIASFDAGAAEQCIGKLTKETCVVQNANSSDLVLERGLMLATNAAINPRGSQRIGGSRPTRLLPQSNGKPSRAHGKLLSGNSYNHSSFLPFHLFTFSPFQKGGAASPRFYYVIALRRILC